MSEYWFIVYTMRYRGSMEFEWRSTAISRHPFEWIKRQSSNKYVLHSYKTITKEEFDIFHKRRD